MSTRTPIAMALGLVLTLPLPAAELRCKVRSVSGAVAILGCDAGAQPRAGERVTLGFEAPGAGFVPLEGSWKVSLIGPGGEIQASPDGTPKGVPRAGHIAIIETDASAADPPPAVAAPPNAAAPGAVDRTATSARDV